MMHTPCFDEVYHLYFCQALKTVFPAGTDLHFIIYIGSVSMATEEIGQAHDE